VSRRLAALTLAFSLVACSQAGGEEPDTTGPADDVVYVGEATDEALARLLDVTPIDVATKRVRILAPSDGDVLSSAAPVEFEVAMPGVTSMLPATPRAIPDKPRFSRWLKQLGHWLQPISVAHAHGTPFSGTGYLFTLSAADGTQALQVFGDSERYTPADEAWSRLAAAKQPLTLAVTYAFFEDNAIPEGGGPFVGGEVSFRLKCAAKVPANSH
jgi:hypothetical protein